jgi:hypothetical protein
MKLSDTFRTNVYKVTLVMPIEVEVIADNVDDAEDKARPEAYDILTDMILANDLNPGEFELQDAELQIEDE